MATDPAAEINNHIETVVTDAARQFGFSDKCARFRASLDKEVPYLAFVRPEETDTKYADFSYVIFTDAQSRDGRVPSRLLVTLCVGSLQFKNDAVLAARPWWRREFLTLINDESFIKSDFGNLTERATSIPPEAYEVLPSDSKYWPLIQAGAVVDVADIDLDKESVCLQWLACYAGLRGWGAVSHGKVRGKYLPAGRVQDVDGEVADLLGRYRYVVLQGAPGVGKTYKANELARGYDRTVFTQFHAETTYTDFIGGLVPDTAAETLKFEKTEGKLVEAIKAAQSNPREKVLLIIDEINRANLANVLGPVFYLFENGAAHRCPLKLPGIEEPIERLPDNLHVLATMNTADRSLAVVDFALRRRFVWYTIRPAAFADPAFDKEAFEDMAGIFRCYASDAELNLQPGPSYYLGDGTPDAVRHNLRYGVLPLIKEYLSEGYLAGSEEDFAAYFKKHADALLFE